MSLFSRHTQIFSKLLSRYLSLFLIWLSELPNLVHILEKPHHPRACFGQLGILLSKQFPNQKHMLPRDYVRIFCCHGSYSA